jgi:hypothetical protein
MQQKIIWMLFLIFGISIIVNISACRKDYALTIEWVYINETDSSISYFPPRIDFNLNPNSSFSEIEITEANQNIDINNVGVPLNVDVIFYNNRLCDTLNGKSKLELGPANIENYEVEKKGENNFKCTFRFTDETMKRAKICK